MPQSIPQLDLGPEIAELWDELSVAIQAVLRSGRFVLGPNVTAFETELAAYLGRRFAIGLNSGTDALLLGLRALGIGAGTEVITSPFSFVATAGAIAATGAQPVFADIDLDTFNLDPKLLEELTSFQGQEATHRLQHQRYNEILCEQRGYDLARFERPLRNRMAWAYRELTARRRLAGTVASEHLTAIMANDMLTYRDALSGADPQVASLWLWHGVEETEHKAVAFDVFIAVGGTIGERRQALLMNTFFFFRDTLRNLCIMLKNDGKLWSLHEWLSGFKYLFIKPGILRRVFPAYVRFYRKDFHPWQYDNRELIAEWEQDYGKAISRTVT